MRVSKPIWREIFAVVLLTATVVVTHKSSIGGDFHFDDDHSIVENPHIRLIENIPNFFTDPSLFSRNEGSAMYRPLLLTTYALNFTWRGHRAEGFLVVNFFIHLLVCVLTFFCHRLVGIPHGVSVLAAMLFAAHPLVVEPINYVSARSTSLALLFALSSLLFFSRSGVLSGFLSVMSYALALCTKSSVIMLPFLFFVFDRVREKKSGTDRWLRLGGHFIVCVLYLLFTHRIIYKAVVDSPVRSFLEQVFTQTKALVYYFFLSIGLQPQSVDHAFNVGQLSDWSVLFSGIFIISILFFSVVFSSSKPSILFWYLSWIVMWLIPTYFVPLNMLVNERRLYEPLVALSLGFSILLSRLSSKKRFICSTLSLIILFYLSQNRTEIWKDEYTLWKDAMVKAPNLVRPYLRLGMWSRRQGDLDVAQKYYQKALNIDPQNAPAFNNLSTLYRMEGRFEDAEDALRASLKIRPEYTEALTNLGSLLSEKGRYDEAYKFLSDAEQLSPARYKVQNNLGTHYLRIGKYVKAEEIFRNALRLKGESARVFYNLGGSLEGQSKFKDALVCYKKALAIDSLYASPYAKIGQLYESFGDIEGALRNYEKFLSVWTGQENIRIDVKNRINSLSELSE